MEERYCFRCYLLLGNRIIIRNRKILNKIKREEVLYKNENVCNSNVDFKINDVRF